MYSLKDKFLSICLLALLTPAALALTDPMQPPAYRGKSVTADNSSRARWSLTSTLIGQHRRLATINGQTLAVGKKINGAKIVDIQPAVVTLSYGDRSIVLKLLPSAVKHRHATME